MKKLKSDPDDLLLALSQAHRQSLFNYVYRMTADSGLAQDIVQESLLKAWKHPSILEQGDGSARAWLFTVARNLVIDDRRSARFRRELATEVLPEIPTADETDAVLDAWLVSDVLATLSEVHRRAIVSAYYLGNSVVEIARQEEVPVGTIKSRLHYALAALRLSLQEKGAGQ
jgi:RNA polymerase sigma-70 factor (ECF subfamily)